MACRHCQCGCAEKLRPIYTKYISWADWVDICQSQTIGDSTYKGDVYDSHVKSGMEFIGQRFGYLLISSIEFNNYSYEENQPENTVQMQFGLIKSLHIGYSMISLY